MDIFSIISLLGGLAFFLYGMKVMSGSLEKISDGKLNSYLGAVTKNRFVAMLFGAGLTIAVQSSSAVTVMLVGLVNSGILKFGQTIGVLMGSNIGTTLTAWILSLAGLESDVVWIQLLKPANFSPLFAFVGILMIMVSKKEKTKSIGEVLLGFAVLMFGMGNMSEAMKPLSEMPEFQKLLTAFTNPLIAVLVGAGFTGIIQSSAASVAILQAFALGGGLTYGMAIPIIMGQNIGTCVTALLSSIGVSKNAKKVAVVHLSFNIIGTLVCLIPFCIGNAIFDWAFVDKDISMFMIAVVHTVFNVFTTLLLLPLAKQLEWIANKIIPENEEEVSPIVSLDNRLLTVPSIAVEKSLDAVVDMCKLSKKAFLKAVNLISTYDESVVTEIGEMEDNLDKYQDYLGTYMMNISKIGVSEGESKSVAKILHSIDDIERIGDHAYSLAKVAEELNMHKKSFSEVANKEIDKLTEAVEEILTITTEAFDTNNIELASAVEPLGQVIDRMIMKIKANHIERLQNGTCTKELGFSFSDWLTSYGRVAGHCSNIAVAIIESQHGTLDAHKYVEEFKESDEYQKFYKEYKEKFALSK